MTHFLLTMMVLVRNEITIPLCHETTCKEISLIWQEPEIWLTTPITALIKNEERKERTWLKMAKMQINQLRKEHVWMRWILIETTPVGLLLNSNLIQRAAIHLSIRSNSYWTVITYLVVLMFIRFYNVIVFFNLLQLKNVKNVFM